MRQANTAWKQQKHMSEIIYGQLGMSQNEVSFFDPKMVTLKGKKVTSFSDISKQEKTCVATMAMDCFWERQASTG